jgi:hypothetical protein
MKDIKRTISILLTFCLLATFAILSGCGGGGGEGDEEHSGPQPLTITVASNADATGHGHSIDFVLNDFSNPPDAGVSYPSTVTDGHSHNLTLTQTQLSDIYGGQNMDATSSVAGAPPHSHVWTLNSGNILYKQNCERCHGAGKLGTPAGQISAAIAANRGGMGELSFLTPAQIQAISTANSL